MRSYFIPGNLDINKLLDEQPPQIPNFSKEKLLDIISLIYTQRSYKSWEIYNGHIQIMSDTFFAIAHDYLQYIKYLKKCGIISRDDTYRPKKVYPDNPKSMGYKFLHPYSLNFPKRIESNTLTSSEKRIKRSRKIESESHNEEKYRQQKLLKEYSFIRYLDDLKFDFNPAYKWLEESAKEFIGNNSSEEDLENVILKYSSYIGAIEQFRKMPSQKVSIDETGKRMHTPLIRLKRQLRYFITYKGEHLVSLDLKNCQPYLSLAFLKLSFWSRLPVQLVDGNTEKGKMALNHPLIKRLVQDKNAVKGRLRQELAIEFLYPQFDEQGEEPIVSESYTDISPQPNYEQVHTSIIKSSKRGRRRSHALYSILNSISKEGVENQMFGEFRKDVVAGDIYEKMIPKLEEILKREPIYLSHLESEKMLWDNDLKTKRAIVKHLMIRAIFAGIRKRKPVTTLAFTLLKESYFNTYELFRSIKKLNHKDIAKLLQRIESFLILKACAQAISKTKKQIPIWTIHDSIVTIEKHKDLVKQIMVDTIAKYIGEPPQISEESWEKYKPNSKSFIEDDFEERINSEEFLANT